jgi:hypothetical protein
VQKNLSGPQGIVFDEPAEALHQHRRKIAGTMEDPDDLQRLLLRVENDQVDRMVAPSKSGEQGSQIFPCATSSRRTGKKVASPQNRVFDPVGRFRIVLAYKVTNLEKIADSFRS